MSMQSRAYLQKYFIPANSLGLIISESSNYSRMCDNEKH